MSDYQTRRNAILEALRDPFCGSTGFRHVELTVQLEMLDRAHKEKQASDRTAWREYLKTKKLELEIEALEREAESR